MKRKRFVPITIALIITLGSLTQADLSGIRNVDILKLVAGGMTLGVALVLLVQYFRETATSSN